MQLLLLLKVSIVLSETLKSELVSGLNVLRFADKLLLERLDFLGISR